MRKAYKYKHCHLNLSDEYDKARDIIRKLSGAVHVKYYEGSGSDIRYLSTPEVEINDYALTREKQELIEKYYPNNKGKSL